MANKSPKTMSEEKRIRQSTMLDMLSDNPGKAFSVQQLMAHFKVSKATVMRDVHDLAAVSPEIVFTGGYICYGPKANNGQAVANDRYDASKTEEGYNDPTAAAAIFKADTPEPVATADDMIPKPGEVWDVQLAADKGVMKVVVLAVTTDASCPFVTCVEYAPSFDALKAKKIYSKPLKYFMAKCWDVSPGYRYNIWTTIRDYLGIEPEIVTQVEKIEAPVMTGTPATDAEPEIVTQDEKVEAPVMTGTHATDAEPATRTYTQDELDLILAEQKAEIYAECFFAAVKKA